jgi:hypothetical protein
LVKQAAVEGLANDPDSIGLLEKVVQDKKQSFKVRKASALSLHNLNHETMNKLAAQIFSQPEDSGGIKRFRNISPDPDEVDFTVGLLNMLTFTGDVDSLKQNEEMMSSLKEVVDPPTDNNKVDFSISKVFTAAPSAGSTIIKQMAAKLLNRIEGNENAENSIE